MSNSEEIKVFLFWHFLMGYLNFLVGYIGE